MNEAAIIVRTGRANTAAKVRGCGPDGPGGTERAHGGMLLVVLGGVKLPANQPGFEQAGSTHHTAVVTLQMAPEILGVGKAPLCRTKRTLHEEGAADTFKPQECPVSTEDK